jgi:hypothetical protein
VREADRPDLRPCHVLREELGRIGALGDEQEVADEGS